MGVLKVKTVDGWISIPSVGPQGATGPAGAGSSESYRRVGQWYTSYHIFNVGFLQGNPAGVGPNDFKANRLYIIPFVVDKERTIEQICVWSYNWNKDDSYYVRFGIYSDDDNMYPGNLLLDVGETNLQFEWQLPKNKRQILAGICPVYVNESLEAGLYWIACVIDKFDSSTKNSGFLAGFSSGSVNVGVSQLGFPLENLNKYVIENNFSYTCYWRDFSYYDTSDPRVLKDLPDPFVEGLSYKSPHLLLKSDNCPLIFVKFAT